MQLPAALRIRATASALGLLTAVALLVGPTTASADGHELFITSARENADQSVATLPLFRGTSHGLTVWYTVADSSDERDAEARGVNFSAKLRHLVGTAAVQTVRLVDGVVDFPATVHFGLGRVVTPGGRLLLTTHGERYRERLSEEERRRFDAGELVVRWEDVAGTNLCAAFHPPAWVRERLAGELAYVDFAAEGAKGNPHQDVHVFRK